MDYVKQILGRSLRELTYDDVALYFQSVRTENEFLEYKSCPVEAKTDSQWEGICKATCGFLNTSGGVIIWGAPKEKQVPNPITRKKDKHCQGPLTNIDPALVKDTIVSKISSNMTPLAGGIKVEILQDNANNRVCVIEIDQSNYAPHQTGNIYYMRLDGHSVPAPHAYIEAMIKRVTYPNLEGYLKIHPPQLKSANAVWAAHYEVEVEIWIFNASSMDNEENLFFSIYSNHAKPDTQSMLGEKEIKVNYNLDELVGVNVAPVLMAGHPYTLSIPFMLDRKIDVDSGTHVNFFLKFGGKKSPMKLSRYSLFLQNKNGRLTWTELSYELNQKLSSLDQDETRAHQEQLKYYGLPHPGKPM